MNNERFGVLHDYILDDLSVDYRSAEKFHKKIMSLRRKYKMRIKLVKNKFKKTEVDPEKIWANTHLDKLRKTECLCLNCNRKNDNPPYSSCRIAKILYVLCKEFNMAIAISRCGALDNVNRLMYQPIRIEENTD